MGYERELYTDEGLSTDLRVTSDDYGVVIGGAVDEVLIEWEVMADLQKALKQCQHQRILEVRHGI